MTVSKRGALQSKLRRSPKRSNKGRKKSTKAIHRVLLFSSVKEKKLSTSARWCMDEHDDALRS
jgi:hypothetical protein